jgi:hypothetical protein
MNIASNLMKLAEDGNLFAAQESFKQLLININTKRVASLCELAEVMASPAPDLSKMQAIVQDLKNELKAISAAEDALGKYIRESSN